MKSKEELENPFDPPEITKAQSITLDPCPDCGEILDYGFIQRGLMWVRRAQMGRFFSMTRLDKRKWWHDLRDFGTFWYLVKRCDNCQISRVDTSREYTTAEAKQLST